MKKKYRFFAFLFLLFALILSMCVSAGAASSKKTYKNESVTIDGDTYYYNSRGKIVRNKFVEKNNRTYYFGSDGKLLKSQLFKVGSKTYYATSGGAIAKNKIITLQKKSYYFNANGVLTTGWATCQGYRWYFLKSGGYLKSCWKKLGSYTYHFNSKGHMDKNKWVDSWYLDANGHRIGKKTEESTGTSKYKKLSVKNIRQNPELPTGCESVALTMVLKYYKFSLSKTTIASRYLPTNAGSNFVTSFAGSPFSSNGCGIYAPGLTITANKFLKAKKSKLRAYDITGVSLKNLYRYIDNGIPVIVWNSMYMRDPQAIFTYRVSGKTWTFYRYEHCVVLCGYNRKKNQVLINDSLSGLVWRNASSFEKIYNKMGKMAVVIQ